MDSFDPNTAWTHELAGHFFVKHHRCGHVGHAKIQSDCRKIFDDVSDETAQSTETSHMSFFGNFIALNGDFGHAYVIERVVHPLIIINQNLKAINIPFKLLLSYDCQYRSPHLGSQNLMPPLILNTNLIKRKLKIDYP